MPSWPRGQLLVQRKTGRKEALNLFSAGTNMWSIEVDGVKRGGQPTKQLKVILAPYQNYGKENRKS